MPGPAPTFTERLDVKISPDQRAQVETWALVLGLSVSEFVRTVLVAAITDFNTAAATNPDVIAARHEMENQHAHTI